MRSRRGGSRESRRRSCSPAATICATACRLRGTSLPPYLSLLENSVKLSIRLSLTPLALEKSDGNVGGVAAGPGDGEMLIDFPQKPGLIARCGHVKEPPGVLPGHPTLWAEAERQGSTWPAVGLSGPAANKRRNWFSPSRGKVLLALPHGLAHLVARHAGCGFARCLEHRSLVRD